MLSNPGDKNIDRGKDIISGYARSLKIMKAAEERLYNFSFQVPKRTWIGLKKND